MLSLVITDCFKEPKNKGLLLGNHTHLALVTKLNQPHHLILMAQHLWRLTLFKPNSEVKSQMQKGSAARKWISVSMMVNLTALVLRMWISALMLWKNRETTGGLQEWQTDTDFNFISKTTIRTISAFGVIVSKSQPKIWPYYFYWFWMYCLCPHTPRYSKLS